MGLFAQSVAVRHESFPRLARATSRDVEWPGETAAGWAWAAPLDLDELDGLAVDAAGESRGGALAPAILDSDVAYLVGAQADGPSFRVVLSKDAAAEAIGWEPDRESGAADVRAWAGRPGATTPPEGRIAEIVAEHRTFAEDGLAALLAALGLVPEPEEAEPEPGTSWLRWWHGVAEGDGSWPFPLVGERRFARLAEPTSGSAGPQGT